ncbi:MAG: aminopeptidase [Clostridia bacterium]|nr:aminopeptidase [Clostridia bacterium]
MAEKTVGEKLKEELFLKKENGLKDISEEKWQKVTEFCEAYKAFLTKKTEREVTKLSINIAKEHGFEAYDQNKTYAAGDKYFVNNRGKSVAFVVVGKKPASEGVQITAAHIDSPRMDLKPNPLYEDTDLALFKTHYYGGIKKYQWTTIPLALHGVFAKKDGSVIDVAIGEDENEPCFVVTDLLPHLAQEQSKRTLSDGIRGEELNVLVGSLPFKDDKASELVKLNILKILNEKYGVTEADFLSAELEVVPAVKPRDVGLDRSLIGAYGHDDRVCAFPALIAVCETENPEKTAVCVLADKEETGSDGNTGLASDFLRFVIRDLCEKQGVDYTVALRNSKCLSADVNAGLDPTFKDVMESRNAAKLNYGAVITKYTGARGKSGTSDASAEYVAYVRNMLDNAGVIWQTGELGRVDLGGGGTVAMYVANMGVDVVDLGVPVLSMHAPFEIVSKLDVYETYRTMLEFQK